jgi:hypothetical protein
MEMNPGLRFPTSYCVETDPIPSVAQIAEHSHGADKNGTELIVCLAVVQLAKGGTIWAWTGIFLSTTGFEILPASYPVSPGGCIQSMKLTAHLRVAHHV